MNSVNAVTKPRTLEAEFRAKDVDSEGKAKFVRKAQEDKTTKTAPTEKRVYLETLARGERYRREKDAKTRQKRGDSLKSARSRGRLI